MIITYSGEHQNMFYYTIYISYHYNINKNTYAILIQLIPSSIRVIFMQQQKIVHITVARKLVSIR